MENNPFAQLFSSADAAKKYSEECNKKANELNADSASNFNSESQERQEPKIPPQFININEKIERLFGITLNPNTKNRAVLLNDVVSNPDQIWIDADTLEQVLFERLILDEPDKQLLNNKIIGAEFVTEKKIITYLFQCYNNIMTITQAQNGNTHVLLNSMIDLILRNISTALKQPEIFSQQNLPEQLSEILGEGIDEIFLNDRQTFLNKLVDELIKNEDDPISAVYQAFSPYFYYLHKLSANSTISNFPKNIVMGGMILCARNKWTADALLTLTTPTSSTPGANYLNTLFGSIFCLSCLPKINGGEYLFFKKTDDIELVQSMFYLTQGDLSKCMHDVFLSLFKSSNEVKEKTLAWVGDCLLANESRGHVWSSQSTEGAHLVVSDGFMINLGSVLLRLAEPIVSNTKNKKFLKIDPTFGSTKDFKDKTCLIPAEEGTDRPSSNNFNFITKIFFLTHKAVDLGYRVGSERLLEIGQEYARLQDSLQDTSLGLGAPELTDLLTASVEKKATEFHSLRCAMTEPKCFDVLIDLTSCTSQWILQVLLDTDPIPRASYEITQIRQLQFPLREQVPTTLTCIPEFFVENINFVLTVSKRYHTNKLESRELDALEPILTLFIVLTRGNRFVKNPHLRAGIIGALEGLLPNEEDQSTYVRTQIFLKHPLRKEIVPSLLDVFVSIEMTGESVTFDQKFKYRHPIYVLIEFLWKNELHRKVFKNLAVEAEKNMEAANPPIFLRFLNLLINDAVYLLDEALSHMAQLRTMQQARDNGEWANLPARERHQNEATLRHTGMIAKFDNILGKWSIQTLESLTTEIKSIFSHPTIVDRIAAMLNYFLRNLVGPNTKNLKVKDMKEYKFKPSELVFYICKIYINLGSCDEFCTAVSQDGRSYNSDLFSRADSILCRTGGTGLSADILAVAQRVAEMASKQKLKEEMLSNAPDEFLDPIMSTLMTDPVILPASNVTVDRTTIARHLLSDQIDPFNRSPLTLEMVKRNDELRERILAWIENKSKTTNENA